MYYTVYVFIFRILYMYNAAWGTNLLVHIDYVRTTTRIDFVPTAKEWMSLS